MKKKRHRNPPKTLKNKLWKLCVLLTRKRHGNDCYTCSAKGLCGRNLHTGHFIPKGSCGAYLKYDLRNLRPQCFRCNIHLGGNGAEFMRKMILTEGQEFVDKIFRDKNLVIKEREYYPFLLEKYNL